MNLVIFRFCLMLMAIAADDTKKRLVLEEWDMFQEFKILNATIYAIQNNLSSLNRENNDLRAQLAALSILKSGQSSVYVHWGRTDCTGNTAELVYRGYISGGHYTEGSGANILCLPEHPSWNKHDDRNNSHRGYIYGAEIDEFGTNIFSHYIGNHDMPCAVCKTTFSVTHMFPGRAGCYQGWVQQYTGYLVSSLHGRSMDMEYYCIDADPESVVHGEGEDNECVLYLVEAKCGSLPCPPYVEGREIACTVCSK